MEYSILTHQRHFNPLRTILIVAGILVLNVMLSGCSGVFFYPDKKYYFSPEQVGVEYEDIYLNTSDQEVLHGWYLKANGPSKGVIYFLHGNAENITSHTGSVVWLINRGYDVFALDYRGYGKSTGSPDIQGAITDIITGYEWLISNPDIPHDNLFILGQSLGGALTLSFASRQEDLSVNTQGVIIDAGFSSYRGIAREKLSDWWLTWPIQYPVSWLIPSKYDSENNIDKIAPVPLLVIHSDQDHIVPVEHGQSIYDEAAEPKQLLITATPHTATFKVEEYRDYFIQFIQNHSKPNSISMQ